MDHFAIPAVIDTLMAASELPQKMLYSRKDAAYALSISVRSLDHLIAKKLLETRRLGKKILIPHGALVRFSRADHYQLTSA